MASFIRLKGCLGDCEEGVCLDHKIESKNM